MIDLAATLSFGDVTVRPIRLRDARELAHLLQENRDWLQKWEASLPSVPGRLAGQFSVKQTIRNQITQARQGVGMPYIIEHRGEMVGQLTVSAITGGSLGSASLGYWVIRQAAGHAITPTAVALVTDYFFRERRLHRMEICIRPENAPSLRVVQKLSFRYEGRRERYIHIDGDWRDHECFALVAENVPEGVLNRWQHAQNTPAS